VISELKGRERNGVIAFPENHSRRCFAPMSACRFELDRCAVASGFTWSAPRDRIRILMDLLGGARSIEIAVGDGIKV
jgi:hypothetical protein